MKAALLITRQWLLMLLLALTSTGTLLAQTAPVQDGVINPGEYGTTQNQQGQGFTWYMTWDANYLYVAVTGKTTDPAVLFFDTSPTLPVNSGGGTMDGIKYPFTVISAPGDVTILPPFQADFALFFTNILATQYQAAASGGWATAGLFPANDPNPASSTVKLGTRTSGLTCFREVRIDRNALGLGTAGAAFNWLGYVIYDPNNSNQTNQGCVPLANPGGYTALTADVRYASYYYTVPDMRTATPFALTSISFPPNTPASTTTDVGPLSVYDFTLNNPNLTVRNTGTWSIAGTMNMSRGKVDMNNSTGNVTVKRDFVVGSGATFIHSSANANLAISQAFVVDGTFVPGQGRVTLDGNGAQQLSAGTYYELLIPGSGTKTLGGNIIILSKLNLTGGILETGNYKVTLAPPLTDPGAIVLSETGPGYIRGTVEASGHVTGPNNYHFGGIGLIMTPSVNSTAIPGFTTVTRYTGNYVTGKAYGPNFTALSQSILRQYRVEAAQKSGLNYKLIFAYRDTDPDELSYLMPSGLLYTNTEANLELFRTNDPVSGTWQDMYYTTRDAAANNLVVTNISNLTQGSFFTLADRARPLPVSLTGFTATATATNVRLRWTTAMEENNLGFAVERSATAASWEQIAFVAGHGTSSQGADYTHLNTDLPTGHWYYRLRQRDANGTESFSSVVSVWIGSASEKLHACPGPAEEEVTISGLSAGQQMVVLDAAGRLVLARTTTKAATTLPVRQLPAGLYTVRTLNNGSQQSVRFMKR